MAGIVVAFKKYSAQLGIWGSKWVGFSNFTYLFRNDASILIRNTLLYNTAFIFLDLFFGILIAIIVTDVFSKKARKVYQSAILLPFLVSIVIVSYIVYAFLSTENGMVNSVLTMLGKEEIQWYATPGYWPFILCFVHLWKGVGYGCMIYIAGISGIDPALYEAARLDGASKWKQIRFITLPELIPSITTLLLLNVGHIFNSDFGLFYQVPQNSGALYSVTNTIDTYVYRALISAGGIGRSSAASVFQSLVGFILVVLSNFIVSKIDKDNAIF
ncbi:ABC transporter permease subunit [Eisenbergiella tayi]|nr:ABC transporter permease subunit [Eisenbergiella tayi]